MPKRLWLYSMIAIASASSTAYAADLPRYNVDAQCEQVASMGGGGSATLKNSCMDMEQDAYDKLKASWANVPKAIQKQCDQVAALGGHGSYTLLDSCIQMETQAAEQPRSFKY